MDKAPDAFRTISEVAEEISVPQHVLRFWESRFTQIRPLKRGGGRRYYRPDDVDLLRGVRHLLYGEGYTIRGVQRILREQGLAFVQNVWRAGAEAPPPEAAADKTSKTEAVIDVGEEPSLFALPAAAADASTPEPTLARREPRLTPPPPTAAPLAQWLGAASEDRRKLQAALDELIACRRLLDAAVSETFAAEN